MHVEVISALDEHLAELRILRHQLTHAHAIEPGERLRASLAVAASAERLARTVHHQLIAAVTD